MTFYSEVLAEAALALDEFGTPVILRRVEVYGVTSSEVETSEAVAWTRKGIITNYKASMVDGTRIQQQDRRVLVTAGGHKPQTDDILELKGERFTVVDCQIVGPGDTDLLFEIQVRQ